MRQRQRQLSPGAVSCTAGTPALLRQLSTLGGLHPQTLSKQPTRPRPCRSFQVGAVIVSPTRELARQIFEVAQPYMATVPWLRALLLVGGT